jgi:hypothetical protein
MNHWIELAITLFGFGWITVWLLVAHINACHLENAGRMSSVGAKWFSKYLAGYILACLLGSSAIINAWFSQCASSSQ